MQTTFDFDNPIAHVVDPSTSHQAARLMDSTGARGRHCREVLKLVKDNPGLTAGELWAACSAEQAEMLSELQEIRRRLTDLRHARQVKYGPKRECEQRRNPAVTWLVAEEEEDD